jgi:hypothetical protein
MAGKFDLDVNAPEKVSPILLAAAERFYFDAGELESMHQSKAAGKPWIEIAKALEAAADRIEKALKRIGY